MTAPFSNSFYGKGNKKLQLLTRLICYSEQSNTIVNKLMFTEFHSGKTLEIFVCLFLSWKTNVNAFYLSVWEGDLRITEKGMVKNDAVHSVTYKV